MPYLVFAGSLAGFLLAVWLKIYEHRRRNRTGAERLFNIYMADQGTNFVPGSIKQYACRLGSEKHGQVTVGKHYLFFASQDMGSNDYLKIGYEKITGLDMGRPNIPYIMNVDTRSLLMNAAANADAGFLISLVYRDGRFNRPIYIGIPSQNMAIEIIRGIENGIEATSIS